MNKTVITFVSKSYTQKAIGAFFVVLLILQIFNLNHAMPLIWLMITCFTAYSFFHFLHVFSKSWVKYPDQVFRKKLFVKALTIRIVVVVGMYILYQVLYGAPFEYGAADALFYNGLGENVADFILNGEFNFFTKLFYLDISDMGFPIYLGFIYVIVFKSILFGRIVNAFIGAWSCVLIYDFTKRNFNINVARIAGIMMMLLPNLIFYCGLTLKETLMGWIIISYISLADKLLKAKKMKIKDILLLTFLGGSLFFFRTVLAVCMVLSLFTSIIIISNRVSTLGRRVFLGLWVFIAIAAIFFSSVGDSVRQIIAENGSNQESQMQNFSTRQGGNAFAKYGSFGVFLPMILIAPFPTFVDTNQNNQMMIAGAVFTRNVYAFFVFVGLFAMYKQKLWRKYVLILTAIGSYLLVLASSGFALSERFHLPVVPLLVVLAAYGVTEMNKKKERNYVPYLVFISLVVIGWNWFKLAGRGM